ncbi:MAG: amidohydrolase family protein [Verrucomicrobiota bacterium]|nr:amidohydrolase family protein [Verrucomicrobiota bacterium]HOU86792.1 amidohydrolase family protein [Verrucomicrobiota bacterium]
MATTWTTIVSDSIQQHIGALGIVDVHEHHLPEITSCRQVNLLQLFQQSYAGWTQARPYPLPSESRAGDPMLAAAGPTTWEALAPYLENSGSSTFVRNLVRGVTELYGQGGVLTRGNWEALDAAVREHHGRPGWCGEVLRRAGIERVITDSYSDPLLDALEAFGNNYNSVLRINAFACGWHPESRDHNENSAHALLARLGCKPESFDDYLAALEKLVDSLASRHQVALKNALAYDRDLSFDEPDEPSARRAWGQVSPSPAERKAFGDLVVDRLCRLAGERDVPVQMHLGTALIRGSHPLNAAGLVERHPRTRFLLMHLAYPWSRELLAMAFVYRNIWLDLTWSLLLSPSHFKLALHEAIELLPDESRLMIGGDNWHVEETYATMRLARRLIGEVLAEKIADGYFGLDDARRLAGKILKENAAAFFGLSR